MENKETLDVTLIEPKFKHPTIFKTFDSLQAGESFVIKNDHDPKPLYYQLLGERGEIFTWEYQENGPDWWLVKIAKKALNKTSLTIGEIAAKDFRKAEVFSKHGVDFCCGGDKTVKEACEAMGISEATIQAELLKAESQPKNNTLDYDSWDLDFLGDYIINTHHRYIKTNLNIISELAAKVAGVHGSDHPELIEIADLYGNIANELPEHLDKEEQILFPYIKNLENYRKNKIMSDGLSKGTVGNIIDVMKAEHEDVGENFSLIRKVSKDFEVPADACNSYTYLYKKLEEFETDLHLHIHLENNILFPKAIEMEKKLFN